MRKKLFYLLTFLLATAIGYDVGWAAEKTATLTMSTSQTSPVTVNGVTFSWSNIATGTNNSNGFKKYSSMTITLPTGATLTNISKTNGNQWGSAARIFVYAGTDDNGTLIATIVTGTNTYDISSNNTGGTFYLANTTNANAWINSLTITYEDGSSTGTVATPTFSPAAGTYTSAQNVAISCATQGATIYYTTNGSTPTTSSTQYSGPISVSSTTTIKAIAAKNGMSNSAVAEAIYTINSTPSGGDVYELVTSISASDVDKKFIIVSETNNFAMSGASNKQAITISDHSTTLPSSTTVDVFTLGGSSGAWTLIDANGKYLNKTSSGTTITLSDDSDTWDITFDANNNAKIKSNSTDRYILAYGSTNFRAYQSSSQSNCTLPQLYRKVEAAKAFSITVDDEISNGTVEVSPTGSDGDEDITITATPATGYQLASLTFNGTQVTEGWSKSNGVYTYIHHLTTGNLVVSATFTQVDYTIDKASVAAGSVSATVGGSPASTAHYGDQVTLAYTPADGYVLQGWTVTDANSNTVTVTNNTFSMPASNVTVTANVIAPQAITRTISTNGTADDTAGGWLGNWTKKSNTTGYVHADYQEGISGATDYSVVAGVGTQVQFQAGTNNGYEIVPANISITSGGNPVSFTTEAASQGGGYIVTFTMPAAPVAISANFTTYISDLYILGTANENDWAGDVGVAMTKPASASGSYSARVYFKGANGYFSFATALGDEDSYPADDKRLNPASNNYDLANNNYTATISSSNESNNSLMLPAGIYDITVNVAKTQVTVAPVAITAELSPATGAEFEGSGTVSFSSNLETLLQAINSGATVTTTYIVDSGTATSGATATLDAVGSHTVAFTAAYGSITATASGSYTVRKMTTPITLFHESFGDNSGGARDWSDDYSVKSGVPAVYSGITGYDVTNARQTKNTMGSVLSGLLNLQLDKEFKTASIVMGPLNVADYESLKLAYQWKPGSVKETYWTKAYYATSSDGGFAELTTSSGSVEVNDFTERLYSLPESAEVSTLYIKVEWRTSNTNGIIDEVDLQGVLKEVAPKAYTIDYAEATGGSASGPEGADADDEITVTVTADTGFACTGISVTTDDENYPTLTATGSGNSYSFDVPVLAAGSTITVTPSFATAYAITYVADPAAGGSITGPASAIADAPVTFNVAANNDYSVCGVAVSPTATVTDNGNGTYSFTMPTAATTVTVTFDKKPYDITVVSVGGTGTVTGLPENAKAVSATPISFSISPDDGYIVSNVVLSYATTNQALTDVDGTYSFTMPAQHVTITVTYFASSKYKLLTRLSDINEEDTYLLVGGPAGELGDYKNVMAPKISGKDFTGAVELVDGHNYVSSTGVISSTAEMAIVKFEAGSGDNEGKYAIKTHEGYFNESELFSTTPSYFSISLGGSSRATIAGTSKYLGYNTQYPRWTFYNEDNNGATYIFKLPSTLAEIISIGIQGKTYTVTDALVGVHAVGNILYAKDEAASIDTNAKPDGYSDFLLEEAFIGKAKTELSGKGITVPTTYSQNNWIALVMPEGTTASNYVGNYLPASTVTGVLTNDVNYELTLTKAPGAPVTPEPDNEFVKNVYTPANFVSTFWGKNSENTNNIYFVKPKVQEVANIAWAVWNGTSFVMPENCPAGSFAISDFTLNSDLAPTLETGKAYAFMAVIENGGSPSGIRRLKSGDSQATFNIKPLNLTSTSPVTGINNVGGSVKEVKSVRVYNVAGVEQRELQTGVNIVVTTYTDGTRTTAKILK